MTHVSTILSGLCLAGMLCYVGEAQGAPTGSDARRVAMPDAWQYTEGVAQTLPSNDRWWTLFNDATLSRLIDMAENNNYDIAMAVRRIDMAKNNRRQTLWQYAPTIGLNASWAKSQSTGAYTHPPVQASRSSAWDMALSASWEVDIFGRIADRARLDGANVRISRAEHDAVQVSLAAEMASNYISLRVAQAQLEVAVQHMAKQDTIVNMTRARHEAGLADKLDVAQALIVLYSTRASVPSLRASIKNDILAIATLANTPVDSVEALLAQPGPLPDCYRILDPGMPADLLRRRPDILQCEAQLAADAASVGIAKKDFLPHLSIDASLGTQALRFGDLFTKRSLTYSIAPTLSWTLFSNSPRTLAVRNARLQMQNDIDNYNLTVSNAIQEVQSAFNSYQASLETIGLYRSTVDEAIESLNLALDLYRNTLTPFSNVVDAQMNVLAYRNSLITARGNALLSLVDLYKALGGGWSEY